MSLSFLGFGSPIVDYNAAVTEEFIRRHLSGEKGDTEHISPARRRELLAAMPPSCVRSCGGSAGNTVHALVKLGISAALFGKLAEDEDGLFFLHETETSGGQNRFLLREPAGETGCCICFVTPDAERTMRSDLGVSQQIGSEDLPPDLFRDRPVFHAEGYMAEFPGFSAVLHAAKQAGCRISLDLSSKELAARHRDIYPALIREYAATLFLNEEEAFALTGIADPEKAMERLAEYAPEIHLKRGASGVLLKTPDGKTESLPARTVAALDTTAAGDYYTAGYFSGIIRGKSEADAARDGIFLASEIVQFSGSRLPEERWNIIRNQLQQEKR